MEIDPAAEDHELERTKHLTHVIQCSSPISVSSRMENPSLSRLESFCRADRKHEDQPNPTVDTLNKYTAALGKCIDVQLVDAS